MAETMEGGFKKIQGSDTVSKDTINENMELLDKRLRRYKKYRSGKDENGVFTIIEYKRRTDDTLYIRGTLSNPDESGNYQTFTVQEYADDGTAPVGSPVVTSIEYDEQGDWTAEE